MWLQWSPVRRSRKMSWTYFRSRFQVITYFSFVLNIRNNLSSSAVVDYANCASETSFKKIFFGYQKRREECERKARRGEMDPRLEFTFQLLIDGTGLPRHSIMDHVFEGNMVRLILLRSSISKYCIHIWKHLFIFTLIREYRSTGISRHKKNKRNIICQNKVSFVYN